MKGTLPDPKWIVYHWCGEVWYYCEEEVVFNSHKGDRIVIPAYYLHNGGSIPWIFTAGLKPNGVMLTYYALHDFTYTKDFPHPITRKHADQLLFEYGEYAGYSWIKRQAVYSGVQVGGWKSWKKHNAHFLNPTTNKVIL
jgi:hypothetical protein